MAIVGLLAIVVVLGFAAHHYLKGGPLKSFGGLLAVLVAILVGFNYYELLAQQFIKRGYAGQWAQPGCLIILFVLTFVVLRLIVQKLIREDVDFGNTANRAIAVLCGIITGFSLAGVVLVAAGLTPLSPKWPYPRFPADLSRQDVTSPRKALLNPDGFAAGFFNAASAGGLGSDKPFKLLHPDYLDQLYLNRYPPKKDIPIIAGTSAVAIPADEGLCPAPDPLISATTGRSVRPAAAARLIVARIAIKGNTIDQGGAMDESGSVTFTLAQLRMVCTEGSPANKSAPGSVKKIHPLGYMKAANQMQPKELSEQINIYRSEFEGGVKKIDFVFELPLGYTPALVEFKLNAVARAPSELPADKAPQPIAFIQTDNCATEQAAVTTLTGARVYGVELTAGTKLLQGFDFPVANVDQWRQAEQGGYRTVFGGEQDNKILVARSQLAEPQDRQGRRSRTTDYSRPRGGNNLAELLAPLQGYKVLALKCNTPSTSNNLSGDRLPILVDLQQNRHHAVGVAAAGKVGDQTVYQVDYCSLRQRDFEGGLVIDAAGAVAQPWPDLWLAERVDSLSGLYVIYMVKLASPPVIITSVKPADSTTAAGFKDSEGFVIE